MNKNDISSIGALLNDDTVPIQERFHALFSLRNIGGSSSIDYIGRCFNDSSTLLKHELAYCLGQMQDKYAVPLLTKILEGSDQDCIVRHEAGEALGAIAEPESLSVLRKYCNDPAPEVAETCDLAVRRIEWTQREDGKNRLDSDSPYRSVDPAPPSGIKDTARLRQDFLDKSLPLYERYRCLFALRNIGTPDCIRAIVEGLECKTSALLRHEVAFVLGQLQSPSSVGGLSERLADRLEHPMVRHECAEALGAVATSECQRILVEFRHDPERIIRESCEVALNYSYDYT